MPRCPKCKTQAEPVEYEGVQVYNCGGCGGYWMSPQRLKVIVERRDQVLPEPVRQAMMDMADAHNTVERLTCFTCARPMKREQFRDWNDIQLDYCQHCNGIWLDRGELEKCQIYWEYAQDNPSAEYNEQQDKRAKIELELAKRKQARADQNALAEAATSPFGGMAAAGIARLLTSLFWR